MLDFEKCWAALERRDAAADGEFFYGVRTTGVYCRPGCASRLPLRKNTMFFETTAAAEAAGLRPCKRCRPTDGSAASRHVAAVERACALLRNSDTMPSLAELADAAGISRFHFHRVFKQITGATPRDYARTHRLGRLGDKLETGQPVTEAIYAVGFGSSSRAYEIGAGGARHDARRHGGAAAAGETIRFVTVETPLGWALVAATERGICMTALGDDRDSLEAALRQRFPAAQSLIAEDGGLKDWADRIVRFITAPEPKPRPAARHPRHRVPGAGVAGTAEDPARQDRELYRDRRGARPAKGGARRRPGLRREQARAARAVPPGDPQRRRSRRLSLGIGAQARAARAGARRSRAGAGR